MGHIVTPVKLTNADDRAVYERGFIDASDVRVYEMEGLVDTGAVMLALPLDVVEHLGLAERRRVSVAMADGSRDTRAVAGPLVIEVVGREMVTECIVIPPGNEVLIGQVILEELDLIADCQKRALYPRPESPIYPLLNLK